MPNQWVALLTTIFLAASFTAQAASDEQKKHAYDVIDRNAEATAIVGDSLFYFGEIGRAHV